MLNFLRSFVSYIQSLYQKPSHIDLANRELSEALRDRLRYHSQAEYFSSMVQFETTRIARLEAYLQIHGQALGDVGCAPTMQWERVTSDHRTTTRRTAAA